jgi:hypothetical protein
MREALRAGYQAPCHESAHATYIHESTKHMTSRGRAYLRDFLFGHLRLGARTRATAPHRGRPTPASHANAMCVHPRAFRKLVEVQIESPGNVDIKYAKDIFTTSEFRFLIPASRFSATPPCVTPPCVRDTTRDAAADTFSHSV